MLITWPISRDSLWGFLKTIFKALRPSGNKQLVLANSGLLSDFIPAYRKALLYLSTDLPSNTGSAISIRITITSDGVRDEGIAEPSTIYQALPVSKIAPAHSSVAPMGYFPSYTQMTPDQRAVYLAWLCDVTAPIEIGYVFVFYYGLERQLLYGNFDAAVEEILLLRKHHANSSFQIYSASALVHACLLRKRVDTLQHLYLDLDFDYFGNSALLILHQQNLDLLPDMLIRLAMSLTGVNKRYIKEKCPMYQRALLEALRERFGTESYPFAKNYKLDQVAGISYALFANISFGQDVRTPSLPNLLHHHPFVQEFETFFQYVHEKAKALRKALKSQGQAVKMLAN